MTKDTPHIEIPLGQNLVTWISPEDAELASMGWNLKKAGKGVFVYYYAIHTWTIGGVRGEYYLHNLVWEKAHEAPLPEGFLVDHINGDKLDNRRHNLRLATRKDNEANKRKRRTQAGGSTTSKYKGVSLMKDKPRTKPWRCLITADGKRMPLGVFATEEAAAEAYNEAAKEVFGEFALLNDIPDKKTGRRIRRSDFYKDAIDKVIETVYIDGNRIIFKFTDAPNFELENPPITSELRYMHTEDNLGGFIGTKFQRIEVRTGAHEAAKEGKHEIELITISTDKGQFTIENHNIHDGWHSGFNDLTIKRFEEK